MITWIIMESITKESKMLEALKKRIEDLLSAVAQSAGQHNALLGRLAEAQDLLHKAKEDAKDLMKDGEQVIDLIEGKPLHLEQENI